MNSSEATNYQVFNKHNMQAGRIYQMADQSFLIAHKHWSKKDNYYVFYNLDKSKKFAVQYQYIHTKMPAYFNKLVDQNLLYDRSMVYMKRENDRFHSMVQIREWQLGGVWVAQGQHTVFVDFDEIASILSPPRRSSRIAARV